MYDGELLYSFHIHLLNAGTVVAFFANFACVYPRDHVFVSSPPANYLIDERRPKGVIHDAHGCIYTVWYALYAIRAK